MSVVVNGVSDFFVQSPKLDNKKLNIVTHHWSDNYMKGFDIYDMLDELCGTRDDMTFTYIGRERGTFKNTTIIPPLFGENLATQLGKYDVYVSASRFDPGPNHILESIACNIPTFAFCDGGGACEFVGDEFIFNSFDDLIVKLDEKNYNNNRMEIDTWKSCMEKISAYLYVKC